MMISGGDYSPNSHTFFKHPFKNNIAPALGIGITKENGNSLNIISANLGAKTVSSK